MPLIMNGLGDTSLNGSGPEKGCWTIGLINSKSKYLTAETFGYKINANGTSMKKKQVWVLEPSDETGYVCLRSHLDRYLSVDQFGNVTCDCEDKCDPTTRFEISVADDTSGRWALKNVSRGYFLGAAGDKLTCHAKVPADSELWFVHLAARPQVNLRSVGRKRFAHLSEEGDEIQVDANVPWGPDTLFTLEFRGERYAIHTCNDRYLSREGRLERECTKDCMFAAEFHGGFLALRDARGQYLSPIGSRSVLKTRSETVSKDELFSLHDSLPQASFVARLNSRYVSVKQGVDVTANQDEASDHETFQLEFDTCTRRWYIRTMKDKYWTLETACGIQAISDKRSSNALFELTWLECGSVAFRANNGKYVTIKKSGHLFANCESIEDNAKFFFELVNRPVLVLKCEQGFVGSKSGSSTALECNKASYDVIHVEKGTNGVVFFKGSNGKYWKISSSGMSCDGESPEGFYLQLVEPSRLCIKNMEGSYLVAEKNGVFRFGSSDFEQATQWEY